MAGTLIAVVTIFLISIVFCIFFMRRISTNEWKDSAAMTMFFLTIFLILLSVFVIFKLKVSV